MIICNTIRSSLSNLIFFMVSIQLYLQSWC